MSRKYHRLSAWVVAGLLGAVSAVAAGANFSYEFVGYNAPSANLETIFGPRIASVDAAGAGFNFGGGTDPLRNLNVISEVFQADHVVALGIGQNSTPITAQVGDLVFAYTLDYTGTIPGVTESPIKDFQLLRLIADEYFSNPPIYNPGPFIALENIIGGAYNTAAEFNGQSLDAYTAGLTGNKTDLVVSGKLVQTSRVQFSWPQDFQVQPGDKAMGLLVAHDVTWMEVGTAAGNTGEGGNILGAGTSVSDFPVLIPVVPEPASMLLIVLGASLLRRRRS